MKPGELSLGTFKVWHSTGPTSVGLVSFLTGYQHRSRLTDFRSKLVQHCHDELGNHG
jgi:hypothetical protein